jgi:microcystin-dependent protein
MSDQYVAEIRIFAGNFAPIGWAFCNGQLMSISQNTALFSLLGVTYGGDGRTTFGLPNLQGLSPLQPGQGGGLSNYSLGETGGVPNVTLLTTELPSHQNPVQGSNTPGDNSDPTGRVWGIPAVARGTNLYAPGPVNTQMSPQAFSLTGGGQPHNNMPPYLALNFIIALQGIFPSRP